MVPSAFAGDYAFASYLIRLRFVRSDALSWLIHLVLASPWGRRFITENAASSAGQHNLSLSKLARFVCPLPPAEEIDVVVRTVEEQLSITDAAFDAVRLNHRRADRLRQSILRDAFAGKLVEQDPADEPAAVLLERIRQARAESGSEQRPAKRPTRREAVGRKAT